MVIVYPGRWGIKIPAVFQLYGAVIARLFDFLGVILPQSISNDKNCHSSHQTTPNTVSIYSKFLIAVIKSPQNSIPYFKKLDSSHQASKKAVSQTWKKGMSPTTSQSLSGIPFLHLQFFTVYHYTLSR